MSSISPSSAARPARPTVSRWGLPNLGIGLGLRGPHIGEILTTWPEVDWFEIITENFLINRGYLSWVLDRIAERYPIVMHGVSLSIGSTEPLDIDYLRAVKVLADRVKAPWISDHVCWTGVGGRNSHDLLPVPYTDEMLNWMVERIRITQEVLERPIFLENPSSYVAFTESPWTEWDFIAEMAERADCGLLVDVNNIYVSAMNHNFDPMSWLAAVPWDRVAQFHVAGHTDRGTHLLDTHIGPVNEPVWALLGEAWQRSGGRSVLLEWDDQIPSFGEVWAEARKAERWMNERQAPIVPSEIQDRPVQSREDEPPQLPSPPPQESESLLRWMHAVVAGDEGAALEEIPDHILPNERMSAHERIDVYVKMVAIRFHEAMAEDYPACEALLGPDFGPAVAAYCADHPSTSWALEHLGRHLPGWLNNAIQAERSGSAPTWRTQGPLPEALAELARLEWAIVECHLADRAPPISPEAIASMPESERPSATLRFAPSMRLLSFERPVLHLLDEEPPPQTRGPEHVLIYRQQLGVETRRLDAEEATLLATLRQGLSLQNAVLAVLQDHPAWQEALLSGLPNWMARWTEDGLVSELSAATPRRH